MKKLFVLMLALLILSVNAYAQYTGPWSEEYNFDNGLQGWVKTSGGGYWVNPNSLPNGPVLIDGGFSNAGGGNLFAPDGTRFELAMPGGYATSLVFQADFYLPNLMPLNIYPHLPGNAIKDAGLGAIDSEGKYIYLAGNNFDGVIIRDESKGDNYNWKLRDWIFEEAGKTKTDPSYWDKWITMQLVYNLNNSGVFTGYVYVPWESGVAPMGWYKFADTHINPNGPRMWETLILGSVLPNKQSYTQTQIDNVKIYAVIPEPASAAVLALGTLPILYRFRKRK
ncbi:MAG: hypothetical protein SNJ70_04405 [Armatimonadota bacterium]